MTSWVWNRGDGGWQEVAVAVGSSAFGLRPAGEAFERSEWTDFDDVLAVTEVGEAGRDGHRTIEVESARGQTLRLWLAPAVLEELLSALNDSPSAAAEVGSVDHLPPPPSLTAPPGLAPAAPPTTGQPPPVGSMAAGSGSAPEMSIKDSAADVPTGVAAASKRPLLVAAGAVAVLVAMVVTAGTAWFLFLRSDVPSFDSVEQIASELAATGEGCDSVEIDDLSEESEFDFGPPPVESASCEFGGEDLDISVYKDAGALENAVGLAEGIGCAFASGFGLKSFNFVTGEQWFVTAETRTTAESVAGALPGSSLREISCE